MSAQPDIRKLFLKDTSFASLMRHRIYNILLIASRYDTFMLEDDGRVDEQLFNEYASLNLRYPPRFTLAEAQDEALSRLREHRFDLIISMPSDDNDTFGQARRIKQLHPDIPIVVLTPFSRAVSQRIASEDLSAIDYVFSWLGNANLLMAIIKLIEDCMNAEDDVREVGVQVLLFVEDSIRFYSSMLPHLYQTIFRQSRSFMTEALNEHQQMLRMRGRPKVVLARSYEEALATYERFRGNLLGVVTDVSFFRGGRKDSLAGVALARHIRSEDKFVPILMQSSEAANARYAEELHAGFICKTSKALERELRSYMTDHFGFGDFIFRDPDTGQEVARLASLRDMQDKIFDIPDRSLSDHLANNHISRWLASRAIFPLAEFLRSVTFEQGDDLGSIRRLIFEAIVQYRKEKNRGVVAVFRRDRFDRYSSFARIGEGSMGGKARGLAFLDSLIKRNPALSEHAQQLAVAIPKTVVLCTDIFDEFMEQNRLYPLALSDAPDEEILRGFLRASLPRRLIPDFYALLSAFDAPIAVRSSSLLEDSHYQPFAGIYSTYMLPYAPDSRTTALRMVQEAIKGVYASVFFRGSKAYMAATANVIDSEKMAIVLQGVCGQPHGARYYPSLSGVARSVNFYPLGPEQPNDGVVNLALGLGKHIVDGGATLRFSPRYPHHILQLSTVELALRETQTKFYALDTGRRSFALEANDACNLLTLPLAEAERDGALRLIASTYDPADRIIRGGLGEGGGRRIITFAGILQGGAVPLAEVLDRVLQAGHREMARHVELELAVNLAPTAGEASTLYLLQIRPVVDSREAVGEDLAAIAPEQTIVRAGSALGHGLTAGVRDIVYVKPDQLGAARAARAVEELDRLNRRLVAEGRPYALIGPGRWGSSDPALGIPVRWQHIAGARLVVEASPEAHSIDPSQGTHFFQNLTALRVGYFTVGREGGGSCDFAFLDALPAEAEGAAARHVRLDRPALIKIDGRRGKGVMMKP
jgi:CheY-like chemotaxis protein